MLPYLCHAFTSFCPLIELQTRSNCRSSTIDTRLSVERLSSEALTADVAPQVSVLRTKKHTRSSFAPVLSFLQPDQAFSSFVTWYSRGAEPLTTLDFILNGVQVLAHPDRLNRQHMEVREDGHLMRSSPEMISEARKPRTPSTRMWIECNSWCHHDISKKQDIHSVELELRLQQLNVLIKV